MTQRVLVVEDEKDIADLICFHLARAGFQAEVCGRGGAALDSIRNKPPALVILDLMLPDMDGIEICKRLKFKEATQQIPILILTARSGETDRILGLELGADDYLPKPFSPRELVLRVQAILRRLENLPKLQPPLELGPLSIDVGSHRVFLADAELDLTSIEFKLLQYLAERPGKIARREDLLTNVWGYNYSGGTRTVDTHVQRLRGKLGAYAPWIETVRGVGYRFQQSHAP